MRTYARSALHDLRHSAAALQTAVRSLAGLSGVWDEVSGTYSLLRRAVRVGAGDS